MHKFIVFMLLFMAIPSTYQAKEAEKVKAQYPSSGKLIKNMDEQELEQVVAYAKDHNDQENFFQAYNQLISHCQDHAKIKVYKLDVADYCFQLEDYIKAGIRYEEFCLLYPGSQESEYAQYKLILCMFYTSLEADKDQDSTTKTVNLSMIFLKHAKNEKFISEIQTIYNTCRHRLFEHEVCVFDTYLKVQKFTGAQKRLEYIKTSFSDVEHIDEYVVYLEKVYDTVKNPATRPFIFKINLNDALKKSQEKQPVAPKDLHKAVSFFVA